jgi:tellurite resistance protein
MINSSQVAHHAPVGADQPISVQVAAFPLVKVAFIPPPAPPTPFRSSGDLWIHPDQEVTVKGFLIKGGMIYVGTDLLSINGCGAEPALINPAKQVAQSAANCHIRCTSYWPSYDSISPEARASYLQWLATGKCDPESDLGYVFLYFYGLERRALWDAARNPQLQTELPLIEREVCRLLGIYGNNRSFRYYASSFLEYLAAVTEYGLTLECPLVSGLARDRGLSLKLRVGLGQLCRTGQSLSAEWAVAWYLAIPNLPREQVISRCPDAFISLFKTEFAKRSNGAMKLPDISKRMKVVHGPASPSFVGKMFALELDLPDVPLLSEPVTKLQEIGDACSSLLTPLSRLLRCNPEKAKSLEALLLTPVCLWPAAIGNKLSVLRTSISEAGEPKLTTLRELTSLLPDGGRLNRVQFGALTRALGSFGLGIEPDVRFHGTLPKAGHTIALFVADGLEQDNACSEGFANAGLMLQMASAVASADNNFNQAEVTLILNHIHAKLDITELERYRLAARLCLFRTSPPNRTGLKRRIEALDSLARNAIGAFLLQVVLADGVIDPREVRVLESLFSLMGLDRASLYSKLHNLEAQHGSTSPAIAASATRRHSATETSESTAIWLDSTKIAALKEDSAKVSTLLEKVFADAESQPDEMPIEDHQGKQPVSSMLDLDIDHAGLLHALLLRAQWSRAELEKVCTDRGLMLDGAIERINEAAFSRFDQALIQGDDPIDINSELMQEETK